VAGDPPEGWNRAPAHPLVDHRGDRRT